MSASPTLFEQPVRVGVDPVVHIRSGFYPNETRCGLGGPQVPADMLRDTDETPTCARCIREKAA